MVRKFIFLVFLAVLAPMIVSGQTFYYAPSIQLSTVDVSGSLANLDSVQMARVNIVPLRVKANGYDTPPDQVTYGVVAPATDAEDAPASTLPATSWAVGNCTGSYTLDGNGRNVWSATAYATVAAAMSDRDADQHIKDVAYVLTPVIPGTPALLVHPNLTLICH